MPLDTILSGHEEQSISNLERIKIKLFYICLFVESGDGAKKCCFTVLRENLIEQIPL